MQKEKNVSTFLPPLKFILVIGRGGRENALAWAINKSKKVEKVFVAPGNGGTEEHDNCHRVSIEESNTSEIIKFCKSSKIDLVIIGAEKPLAEGLADELREAGLTVFGPGKKGAQLEASKKWAKSLMIEANIPTAKHWTANNEKDALQLLKTINQPLVVKADGLASGKGVTVCKSIDQTQIAIKEAFQGKFGFAGSTLLLEECLEGPEVSIFAISDGEDLEILPPAQDHKRLLEQDQGPNTGGMGAYAPTNIISANELEKIKELILSPTLKALKARGINYQGVIYAGLMLTKQGPKVIEYNCRFGDPECQALMPLMNSEFAQIIQAAALGSLKKVPSLKISPLISACVVAATSGYPENPRVGDFISFQPNKENRHSTQIFHAGTEVDNSGSLITAGGRVLSIVAQAEDYDNAFKLVYKRIEQINFNGMYYRRDIGRQVRK